MIVRIMKKILSLVIIGTLAFASCSKMLDIPQHGNVSTLEDYYSTDEEVESAVAAMYNQMKNIHMNFFYCLTSLDDDTWTGGMTRGDNSNMEKFNEYTFDASHEWLKNTYVNFYELVYKSSLITEHVTGETPAMKRAVYEARVMRALANFYLVTMWGYAPMVDHVLKPEEYRVSNSNPEAFWSSIETDLKDAIASGLLPSKKDMHDKGTGIRITKEFAYALLGKAYLWQKKYNDAAASFDKVISSGLYGLYGVDEPGEYEDLLRAKANNCCESLLEGQWRNDPSVNQMTTLWCSMSVRDSYFDSSNNNIAFGWNFINPSKSLYDTFVAEEGEDGYRLVSTIKTRKTLADKGLKLKTVWIPGNEGYFNWKYTLTKDELYRDMPGFQIFNWRNFRIMRYAEVLLCAAEANLQAGNQAKADQYVNQVRSRAKLSPKTGVTLDDIKTEKRLELWGENLRWLDLVRWGDAEKVMGEQGHYVPSYSYDSVTGEEKVNPREFTNTVYGFKEKHNHLPIPANEIQVNPNIKQNPGW
ncbi:MAG: RagB/SusD family nutrient uptake outer membrane protein [Bacteroidales bacterium]|nr:RagB/SusD family nutrient uptake outer membrane protein [Bacteroidales bacterium]